MHDLQVVSVQLEELVEALLVVPDGPALLDDCLGVRPKAPFPDKEDFDNPGHT